VHAGFDFPGVSYPGMRQATRAGDWVTVSGQLAFKEGKLVGAGDAHAQALQCFSNLSTALALAGATLADVVKLTCYLTDLQAYAGYAAIKSTLFASNPPTGTAVIVAALLVPGALIEVEALAYTGKTQAVASGLATG
jgi:enamine deaminase RidA (YjgF/YER057c/UK114 family)